MQRRVSRSKKKRQIIDHYLTSSSNITSQYGEPLIEIKSPDQNNLTSYEVKIANIELVFLKKFHKI